MSKLVMNDAQIRAAFHHKRLKRYHNRPEALVIDELGLQHGKSRADIAVVNGHLNGFEIKSDVDSLVRLSYQIEGYSAVFDYAYLILTDHHFSKALKMLPKWWGVIYVMMGPHGAIYFNTIRYSMRNKDVDDYSVAQLLWRDEAREILMELGIQGKPLLQKRSILYKHLVDCLPSYDLRAIVRDRLKKRRDWRNHAQLSPGDD